MTSSSGTNQSQVKTEGWSWLFNSRRDHYFVGGKSLCGKWGIMMGYGDCDETTRNPCATCLKKLQTRKEKKHDST